MKKDASEIIEQLGELIKGMWGQSENPDGLRKTLNDIAVLNWALALWWDEFQGQERSMKAELDLEKANLMEEFVNKGEAVNRAEIKTTIALAEKRIQYNKMASSLDKVKIMGRACEKAMDSLRSQLATIRKDT